jgi:DNA-directed RNA polymerase specialized sigma24 family protein
MTASAEQSRAGSNAKSLDEVEDALDQLADEDIERLIAKADGFAFGTGVEGRDLFGDAVRSALEGARSWPDDITFVVFLTMSMKSIAWNLRRKARRTTSVDMSVEGHGAQDAQQRSAPDAETTALAGLRCKALVEKVFELFADDEKALAVVMGRVDRLPVDEICELGNIERNAYETVSKRVQRKLAEAIGSGAIQ